MLKVLLSFLIILSLTACQTKSSSLQYSYCVNKSHVYKKLNVSCEFGDRSISAEQFQIIEGIKAKERPFIIWKDFQLKGTWAGVTEKVFGMLYFPFEGEEAKISFTDTESDLVCKGESKWNSRSVVKVPKPQGTWQVKCNSDLNLQGQFFRVTPNTGFVKGLDNLGRGILLSFAENPSDRFDSSQFFGEWEGITNQVVGHIGLRKITFLVFNRNMFCQGNVKHIPNHPTENIWFANCSDGEKLTGYLKRSFTKEDAVSLSSIGFDTKGRVISFVYNDME
ncbi:MAG: hypothetical protein ACNI26_12265 [Terasakiella sp.]|uniref:hypothetical protein n=1 Tax=unclassified Terasakiella TaxID=2614952 RepID=UPI003B00C96F